MPWKNQRPQQIIANPRDAVMFIGLGPSLPEVARVLGGSLSTLVPTTREVRRLHVSQAEKLKESCPAKPVPRGLSRSLTRLQWWRESTLSRVR